MSFTKEEYIKIGKAIDGIFNELAVAKEAD